MRARGSNRDGEAPSLLGGAIAGTVATYGMDLAARRLVVPALRIKAPSNLGRWIGHMFKGRFRHEDITKAEPIAHEATIALIAHYGIGLTLGAAYALLLRVPQDRRNSLSRATAYGVATTAFPWFWMFPARGQGVMGLRDGDLRVPAFALCTHVAWGLGLGAALRLADSRLASRASPCSPRTPAISRSSMTSFSFTPSRSARRQLGRHQRPGTRRLSKATSR